jgi:hypothetical protein
MPRLPLLLVPWTLLLAAPVACDDDGGDSSSDGGDVPCTVDADCDQGYECEVEHDESYCKPHGGDDGDDGEGKDDGAHANEEF